MCADIVQNIQKHSVTNTLTHMHLLTHTHHLTHIHLLSNTHIHALTVSRRASIRSDVQTRAESIPEEGPEDAPGQGRQRRRYREVQGAGGGVCPRSDQTQLEQIAQ